MAYNSSFPTSISANSFDYSSPTSSSLSEPVRLLVNGSSSYNNGSYNNGGRHLDGDGGGNGDEVLSKFEVAKNEMINHFVQLKKTSKALSLSLNDFCSFSADDIGVKIEMEPIESAIGQIDHINDVISRDQMKVVFFGRTSSGKSTVANAILNGKILPTGMGDTTNCFITMQGTDQSEPYMIHPLHPNTPQSVHSVAQLAHALDKNKLQRSSQLVIFWPSELVELLRHDIQLIDSPGISVDIKTDTWIDKYCLDADVFIFVANAESTIMETEKHFFHKVSQHLSKPNMFILQNKWDLADCSDVDPQRVKQQHIERSIEFLTQELKVMDDALEAEKRIFFISAKEELNFRIQESKGQTVSVSGEYKNEVEERRREFKAFEKDFKFCVCDSAIKTKFEKHTQKGMEIMSKVHNMLDTVTQSAKLKKAENGEQHNDLVRKYKQMKTRSKKLDSLHKEELSNFANQVQANISTVMGDEILQLSIILEKFPKPFPTDHSGIAAYKQELFSFIDKELKNAIDLRYHSEIVNKFDLLRSQLIENAEQILSDSWLKKQTKPISVSLLRNEQRMSPTLNFSISCNSLCAHFKEDLSFNFTLGLNNLVRKVMGPSRSKSMVKKAADAARRNAQSVLDGAGGITGQGDSGGDFERNNRTSGEESSGDASVLLPILATLNSLPSMGPIGLVVIGGIIWSKISWKMIAIVGGCYVGFYAYERLTWNVVAKQRSFKRQLVDFATPQLSTVIPLVSEHCSGVLIKDINKSYETLKVDIDDCLRDTREQIENCESRIKHLNDLVDVSVSYVALIHRHEEQFSSFLQRFLQPSK